MKRATTNELRRTFLSFFKERGHPHVPMAPLVSLDDPTLLFTSAGMVPFKPYYSSPLKPPIPRAVTVQRCLRLTDIESVGRTVRHATFFEMLGNFSFGDYFKKEAIEWAWEFTTQVLGMPEERLWPSVYRDDREAFDLWAKHIGLGADRVARLDEKDNFWGPAGGSGPCGPCSEIYWDSGPGTGCARPECAPGCDCERYLEFWNLVFPQFDQTPTGERRPLANRGIDTGMGLERLAMILQDVPSIFETDLLLPLGDAVRRMGTPKEAASERGRVAARVITDHVRALVFTFAEGVRPSNEGRGYVVRRLLRRASRLGRHVGIEGPFLARLVPALIRKMAAYEEYGYLVREEAAIAAAVQDEESRFAETLELGVARFEETVAALEKKKERTFPGEVAFLLYDTYGFPLDLTDEMAAERGLGVDREGYERAMEEQRERARQAARFDARRLEAGPWRTLSEGAHSEFRGYEEWTLEGVMIRSVRELKGAEGPRIVEFTLDRTPFYAEAGGQVGDTGTLTSLPGVPAACWRVIDTVRDGDTVIHRAETEVGEPHAGPWRAEVDAPTRAATQRNHTATHLLHAALRARFGAQLRQAGSLVAPDRLRFDLTHGKAFSDEDIRAIEEAVNEKILEDIPVRTEITSLAEAQARGAMALFGEKYGERVRQVVVGDYSRELCGGCHVRRTGEIGYLRIESESAIASGTRRIEALTGAVAYRRAEEDRCLLRDVAAMVGAPRDQLAERLGSLRDELARLRAEHARRSRETVRERVRALIEEARGRAKRDGRPPVVIGEVEGADKNSLREARDLLAKELPDGAGFLAAVVDSGIAVSTTVGTKLMTRLPANEWASDAVSLAGGRGGGKRDRAEAGARDPSRIQPMLERARAFADERLAAAG